MDIVMLIILIKMLNKNIKVHPCYKKPFSVFYTKPVLGSKYIFNILPLLIGYQTYQENTKQTL